MGEYNGKRKEGIACKECGRTTAIIEIAGAGSIERVDLICDDCEVISKFKRKTISGGTPVKMAPGQTTLPKDVQKSTGDEAVDEPIPAMKGGAKRKRGY